MGVFSEVNVLIHIDNKYRTAFFFRVFCWREAVSDDLQRILHLLIFQTAQHCIYIHAAKNHLWMLW